MDLGLLVVILVFAVFVPVGIITYLVVIPRLRKREAQRKPSPPAG
ncbi:MAG: hypothetical protein JWP66_974 [Naasia sp.]|nr:hypothetical protein [Naasia sp.]